MGVIPVSNHLFVKINSITQCLKPGVDCSLYVDDFQICYISSNMSISQRQLQLCLEPCVCYQQLFMEIRDRYRDYIPVYILSYFNSVKERTYCTKAGCHPNIGHAQDVEDIFNMFHPFIVIVI